MKESDWKIFKKIKAKALEQLCAEIMSSVCDIINDEESTEHERYLKMYKKVITSDKELGKIFNGLSRKRAFIQLLMIRQRGLADMALVSQLSEEFQQGTDPDQYP